MHPGTLTPEDLQTLAEHLETLASSARLQILHAVRMPTRISRLRVTATLSREGERPDRFLARQSVTRHVEALEEASLVRRVSQDGDAQVAIVLNHPRLFAVVDELRGLARLRPELANPTPGATDETMEGPGAAGLMLPELPRLVVAYGRDDGEAWPLHGRPGTAWDVGRSSRREIHLDYDPYLSSRHARIERREDGFIVRDLGSSNGTRVNWARIPEGGERPLRNGDVITVGRTALVLQA